MQVYVQTCYEKNHQYMGFESALCCYFMITASNYIFKQVADMRANINPWMLWSIKQNEFS